MNRFWAEKNQGPGLLTTALTQVVSSKRYKNIRNIGLSFLRRNLCPAVDYWKKNKLYNFLLSQVAWIHIDRQMILTIHRHVITRLARFSVSHDNAMTWLLHVSQVQQEDRGYYMCQVNTNPMISQVGYLQVVGKLHDFWFFGAQLIYNYFLTPFASEWETNMCFSCCFIAYSLP